MAMYPCLFGGGGGSQPVLITKNITQNGTYNAADDNADGYSSVKVEVSGGGSTLGEKTISTYGVYNASDDSLDGYSKVTNVTGLETATASGAVVSISDAVAMPCPSVVAQIVPVQAGSGTPSPSNVRPISGFSSAVLTRDQGTGTTPTTYTAALGRTVYGGTIDFASGTLTVTHGIVNLGACSYTYTPQYTRFHTNEIVNDVLRPATNNDIADIYCECYQKTSSNGTAASVNNYVIGIGSSGVIQIRDTDYTSGYQLKLALQDKYLVYPLATPLTFSITPPTITTAQGVNNFYADTGDTAASYYREKTSDSYLYNVDAVYFNTGYTHKANTKLVLDCEPWQGGGGYTVLCGARAGSYANNAMLFFGKFNGNRYGWSRTGQEEVSDYWNNFSGNYAWYHTRCIITMEGKTCTVLNVDTGETRTITCANATVNDGIAPIALFCDNNSSSADGFAAQDWATMKFYSLKIYENDVLVHNFVPAYNNNQYCIYDTVDQVYKYDLQASGAYLNGYVK